jgi:hypothetical protein
MPQEEEELDVNELKGSNQITKENKMLPSNDQDIITLLENMWTNYNNQLSNSTLGGLHMTQTNHDFVKWANPTRNSPK